MALRFIARMRARRAANQAARLERRRARNVARDMRRDERQQNRATAEQEQEELFTVPDAPMSTDRTGIKDPRHSTQDEGQTVAQLGQGVVDASARHDKDSLAAQEEDKAQADTLADDVAADADETVAKIDEQSMALEEDADRVQESIANQAEALKKIPGEVKAEFEDLRGQLSAEREASFERIEGQRGEALSQVMEGRSSAMQAAVQGIQGNVNNQIASIQSNPNLTDSQKQGMVAQIRMSGAGAIAPAIGKTVLGFNQLSADVATKFGAITGQLEGIGLQVSGDLMGQQGNAYAQAQVAVGEMANQLIDIDASSSAAFAQGQSQLLATRTHAQMTSNDILLRTLPLQNTPYPDTRGTHTAAFEIGMGIQDKDFIRTTQVHSMGLTAALTRSMIGTPQGNFLESALAGLQAGGPKGMIWGGIIGAAQSVMDIFRGK